MVQSETKASPILNMQKGTASGIHQTHEASKLQIAKEIAKLEGELAAAKASAEQLSLAYSHHLILTAPSQSGVLPCNLT